MHVSEPVAQGFQGTTRFAVRKALGSGGMGVVYHAYDRVKGLDVALKTLRYLDADAIYRLKKEFRSLADVSHPNLVTLHELIFEGDVWFFTMELVRGTSFLDYVTSTAAAADNPETLDVSAATVRPREPMADGPEAGTPITESDLGINDAHEAVTASHGLLAEMFAETASGPSSDGLWQASLRSVGGTGSEPRGPNIPRLRAALKQLASGVQALHQLGKLHRDLKPSNVLVTPAGRVVILDFGLVTELFPDITKSGTEAGLAGTLAYMAPETGGNAPLTPASDWYSVGVILFEALTGRLPFPGAGVDVLLKKAREEAPPIPSVARALDPELADLATALLNRDPKLRPTGEQLLVRLGAPTRASTSVGLRSGVGPRQGPFIGRNFHLGALESAFLASQSGRPIAVFVRGRSGVGKTALVHSFLEELKRREAAVVLSGRCYERETVPFKALDSLIDSLSRHLAKLKPPELDRILPRGIRALARIFPVLLRVEAIDRAPRLPAETPDQQELQRRAFRALRELLQGIAAKRPLVLFIDDLQWGDLDSAKMLLDLLGAPEAPSLLLLGCYRSDDEPKNPVLRELMTKRSELGASARVLTVGALSMEEAKDLTLTLLHRSGLPEHMPTAQRIARESEGNPFFIEAMVRHHKKESLEEDESEISLGRVLQNGLTSVSPEAQQMLALIAVAGRPLPLDVIAWAAGASAQDEQVILGTLKAANLARATAGPDGELVEIYHNRLREVVLETLTKEQIRDKHRALAGALEALRSPDIEALFFHLREAGDRERAAGYAIRAGDQASRALAFDRAAQLYKIALELSPEQSPAVQHQLRLRLGDALAFGGRGPEAAHVYLESAQTATELEALDLRRLAAEQLLVSGHIDRGLKLLREVLDKIGFGLAKTPRGAYYSRVMRRGKLWRRGFSFEPRAAEQVSQAKLTEIDVLCSAATGLVMTDFIRGADCQTDHVLRALDAGEPYRIARALAVEACYVSTGGTRGQWRTAKLLEASRLVAEQCGHPHALGLAGFAEGAAAFFEGHWARARILLERAEEIFRDRCTGVIWELIVGRLLHTSALFHLGQVALLTQRVPLIVDEAELRGDLFTGTLFRVGHASVAPLVSDSPERALRQIDEAMTRWSHRGYHVQHGLAALGRCRALIYAGHFAEAHELMRREWPNLQEHYLLKPQYLRVEAHSLKAHAALALARTKEAKGKLRELCSKAEKDIRTIRREEVRWAQPLADVLEGAVAEQRGELETARARYQAALVGFQASGMSLYEAAAKGRLGALIGGESGQRLLEQALERFVEQGVRNPARFMSILAP